jgi:hypothetical protein
MRRDVCRRIKQLEERAGVSLEPTPSAFILFPDSEWNPGNVIDSHYRYGHQWKRRNNEEPDQYHARISAQLLKEGQKPPFIFLIFADPPDGSDLSR